MRLKIKNTIPLLVVLVLIAVINVLYLCADASVCALHDAIWKYTFGILEPTLIFAEWLVLPCLMMLFVKDDTFVAWVRMSRWLLVLALAFTTLVPTGGSGFGPNFFPYYRVDAARDAGIAFTLITAIFIGWKYFSSRKKFA